MTNTKTQKSKSIKQLELEIESLKQALKLKDTQLKEKTEQLELIQDKLAMATGKAAHELRTPLHFLNISTVSSLDSVNELF